MTQQIAVNIFDPNFLRTQLAASRSPNFICPYRTRGQPITRISSPIDDLFTCGAPLDKPLIFSPENWQPGEPDRAPRLLQALLRGEPSPLDELPYDCDPKPLNLVASKNRDMHSSIRSAINHLENPMGKSPIGSGISDIHELFGPDEVVPNSGMREVLQTPLGVQPLVLQGKAELLSQSFSLDHNSQETRLAATDAMTLIHLHTSSNPNRFEQRVVMIEDQPNNPQDTADIETDDDSSEYDETEDEESITDEANGLLEEIKKDYIAGRENSFALSANLREGETLYLPPNWRFGGLIKGNDDPKGWAWWGWAVVAIWHFIPKVPLPRQSLDEGSDAYINAEVLFEPRFY